MPRRDPDNALWRLVESAWFTMAILLVAAVAERIAILRAALQELEEELAAAERRR